MATRICLATVLMAGLLCSGCLSYPAGLSASTKPLAPDGYTVVGPAKGSAFGVVLLCFPISEPNPARTAVDRAIKNGGGDAMINVTADVTQIPLGIITLIWTTVEGVGVQSTN